MRRMILLVALLLVSALWLAAASCPMTSVCPDHGKSASFSGRTSIQSGGCIYGLYKHGGCGHWTLCYCPGE